MDLALFDFDGTLTTRDTIRPLGKFLVERVHARSRTKMAAFLLLHAALESRVLSNHRFKEGFCALLLLGQSEAGIDELSEAFAECYVDSILNLHSVAALRAHQCSGDDTYLLSSNFSFALRPWQRRWRTTGIIATDAAVERGRYTGQLVGRACDGREKLRRALAHFGPEPLRCATAYGDSRSDRFVMESVGRAIWV